MWGVSEMLYLLSGTGAGKSKNELGGLYLLPRPHETFKKAKHLLKHQGQFKVIPPALLPPNQICCKAPVSDRQPIHF